MIGICEQCNMTFLSRDEEAESAEQELRAKFDAHTCESVSRRN